MLTGLSAVVKCQVGADDCDGAGAGERGAGTGTGCGLAGAGRIVNWKVAGALVFPAASRAVTEKTWPPGARPE
jgi:hypothetical protein